MMELAMNTNTDDSRIGSQSVCNTVMMISWFFGGTRRGRTAAWGITTENAPPPPTANPTPGARGHAFASENAITTSWKPLSLFRPPRPFAPRPLPCERRFPLDCLRGCRGFGRHRGAAMAAGNRRDASNARLHGPGHRRHDRSEEH